MRKCVRECLVFIENGLRAFWEVKIYFYIFIPKTSRFIAVRGVKSGKNEKNGQTSRYSPGRAGRAGLLGRAGPDRAITARFGSGQAGRATGPPGRAGHRGRERAGPGRAADGETCVRPGPDFIVRA